MMPHILQMASACVAFDVDVFLFTNEIWKKCGPRPPPQRTTWEPRRCRRLHARNGSLPSVRVCRSAQRLLHLLGSTTKDPVSCTVVALTRAKSRDMCASTADTHWEIPGTGCTPLHFQHIVTQFWTLALLAYAPPAAAKNGQGQRQGQRKV